MNVRLNAGCGSDRWGNVRVDLIGTPTVFASIEQLPFRDLVFYEIKFREVLEHLDSAIGGLRELARVLRGRLYISVPNVYFYRRLLRTLQKGWKINVAYGTRHLQVWDIITMRQLLYQVGLVVVRPRFSVFSRYLVVVVKRKEALKNG